MQPLSGSTYPGGSLPAASIVSRVLSSMKKPVYLLDITTLSQLRKDAHPSTYGAAGGSDCSHWCLPGLPDTWNQLLYAALSMWRTWVHTHLHLYYILGSLNEKVSKYSRMDQTLAKILLWPNNFVIRSFLFCN